MDLTEWLKAAVSVLYASNAFIGMVGYIPTLTALWWLYRSKKGAPAISITTYMLWCFGALNTGNFGFLIAESWEMVFVGYTTLIFNLAVLVLALLIRRQGENSNDK